MKPRKTINPQTITDSALLAYLRKQAWPTLDGEDKNVRPLLQEAKKRIARLKLTKDELIFLSLIQVG
jgi:hypothetical protein